MHHRGLTLIEVMVLLVALGILLALLWPALHDSRERSNRTKCLGNLKNIALGIVQYENNTQQGYPSVNPRLAVRADAKRARDSLGLLCYEGSLRDFKLFVCPSTEDRAKAALSVWPTTYAGWDQYTNGTDLSYAYDYSHVGADGTEVVILTDRGAPGRNSPNHDREGQVVVRLGSWDARWETNPTSGWEGDDIYALNPVINQTPVHTKESLGKDSFCQGK